VGARHYPHLMPTYSFTIAEAFPESDPFTEAWPGALSGGVAWAAGTASEDSAMIVRTLWLRGDS
jgi:hypothetical protein